MKRFVICLNVSILCDFLSPKRNQKAKCFGAKTPLFVQKDLLYDADWAAQACKLNGKSMLIAGLYHVNKVQDDELKALNAQIVFKFFLFFNFVLSKSNYSAIVIGHTPSPILQ